MWPSITAPPASKKKTVWMFVLGCASDPLHVSIGPPAKELHGGQMLHLRLNLLYSPEPFRSRAAWKLIVGMASTLSTDLPQVSHLSCGLAEFGAYGFDHKSVKWPSPKDIS